MIRPALHNLDGSGATNGQIPVWNATTKKWTPAAPPASGVTAVAAGINVIVDNTDPAHPVISAAQVLMADGVTSPPVPIETEAGDDWLYQD